MADCGLLNLATCLPQKFLEYISGILSSPIQPLLDMVKGLLSAQVNLDLFSGFWAIMIYVLSMFYAFLILYSGFSFILSGYDARKRESSKEWLKNIVIMIILIQCSFFIYELAVQLSSVMTSTTLGLANNNFFTLRTDNISNLGLELLFFTVYLGNIILTGLILIVRYAIVSIGLVLFPLAIFFYFIQPLRSYGLLLINFIGVALFITVLDSILIVGFSKLIDISLFSNIKILVVISAFGIINIMMFFLMFFSIIKSAFNLGMKGASIATKVASFI